MRRKDLMRARREWNALHLANHPPPNPLSLGMWAAHWAKYLLDDSMNLRKIAKQKAAKRRHTFAKLRSEENDRDDILEALEDARDNCKCGPTMEALTKVLEMYDG